VASVIYSSFLRDLATGAVDADTDSFKALLTTSSYTESKSGHSKRSSVTNEVSGTGYTAGGVACTVTVSALDATNHRFTITLGAVSWASSTITARKLVVYKARGGASSADELVACVDFGADVTSTANTLSVAASTITIQN
jgi:hypothetical protein